MLFSYFMVEMTPFENRFLEFFTALVDVVKPGTLFLGVERTLDLFGHPPPQYSIGHCFFKNVC